MKSHFFYRAIGVSFGLAALSAGAYAQYVATLLHPATSIATGASGTSYSGAINFRATLWSGSGSSYVDLNPAGFAGSRANGVSANYQVGFGDIAGVGQHALLWNGTASSYVDLHPNTQFLRTEALGVAQNSQVGYGNGVATNGQFHAMLWQGTASSFVDLHPTGYVGSTANAVFGGYQAGWTESGSNFTRNAALWQGPAGSHVNLNPSGSSSSVVNGLTGDYQVGYANGPSFGNRSHAILWRGSANDYTDLHPVGYENSYALGAFGDKQVGYAIGSNTGNWQHAMLWNGTANSFVDLHSTLSSLPVTMILSQATGISENGDIVGYGQDSSFNLYALKWSQPVPEPGTLAVLGLGIGTLCRRRRAAKGQSNRGVN